MKLRYILSLIAIVAISKNSFAQYANDAVKFSTAQPGTTSRLKGIGNAGTAIGGDLSSVSLNPAGIGFFTKSEFSITPEFNSAQVKADYFGKVSTASKNNFNLSNASIVFYTRLNTPRGISKSKGWLSLNFGAAYSHTNDFNERISYKGTNPNNSINDYYANLANSGGVDAGLPGWAYDHNLIDQYGTANPTFKSNALPGVAQTNDIVRSGGQTDINLSMGANYSNKLYLGLSLAVTDLQYTSANHFNEVGNLSVLEGTPPVGVTRGYNSTYSQYQNTKGAGINVKLGVIYKIVENFRIGATITSPTYLSVDDIYSEELNTSISNGSRYSNGPDDYPLTYSMRTPFKASGGLSIFISKFGFITGDVEYVDYSTTHINSDNNFNASYDNDQIKNNYRATLNARVGAEIRVLPAIMLRGGYGIQDSPLKTNGKSINTVSGGLGYHFGSYSIDAAYQHLSGSSILTPYTLSSASPSAALSRSNNNVFLTFAYRY